MNAEKTIHMVVDWSGIRLEVENIQDKLWMKLLLGINV